MDFSCKIILDSISPAEKRIVTMEVTDPRIIHAELLTHRAFSRNAASSRAIPAKKMIERVSENPFFPLHWGANEKGMQAKDELPAATRELCAEEWQAAFLDARRHAERLTELGLHKQIVNRILEPFSWITVVITATEWSNFFAQRCHPDAEPHLQKIAYMMRDAYEASTPIESCYHLPYLQDDEAQDFLGFGGYEAAAKVCIARCARVSYLNQDGKRDINADIDLYNRLLGSGHMSPFEHVAEAAINPRINSGNFVGWMQYRKQIPGECR